MVKRTILIFGGAFNPPTLAHEAIIAACLAMPQFDEVWLMPSGNRADKHIAVRGADRLAMLQLVRTHSFANNPRLRISDFELHLPQPTTTYQTVHALQAAYPHTTFWFAFGRDSYMAMPQWEHGRWLQKELPLVIFASGAGEAVHASNVTLLDIPGTFAETSSTLARKNVLQARTYVSPAVLSYMAQHTLYKE